MASSSFTRARWERNRTPGDILYEALADLTRDDFIRFKDKLSDFHDGGLGPIPRGRLDKADYVATKNLLIDSYGEESALDVTTQVLQKIGLMGPAGDLQHRVTQHDNSKRTSTNKTLEGYRKTYVDHIREKYEVVEDHNARLGEYIKMEKRYITLLIINNYRDEKQRQHEITASGQRHLQIMSDRSSDKYSPTTIQALLDPDGGGIIPKTVVLQGPAGIGKTMTSQKIMLDWASGNLYKDRFKFVFYISCREVNTISGNISLAGYLSRFCELTFPPDLLRSIFVNSEEILFIVDGFDELKWSPMKDTEVCDDPFQEVSKKILLNSLLRRKILSKSSLIITTRPLSLKLLKDYAQRTRYVEILGFTGNQREEYFYHFFQAKEQADLVFSTIKDNDYLFTMCVIPIICWILCTVMKQQLQKGLHTISCKTSTSVYLLYLKSLIKYHGRNAARSISTCIQKLCALANEGVWYQRILFEESDLARHGLSVSEVESVFLNENIFHRDIDTRTCYSFIHLSVQEFFAALYYVLHQKSIKKYFNFLKSSEVRNLLEASEERPHLTLTVQFLFGLSSEKQIQETQRTIGCPIFFREKPVVKEWIKRKSSVCHNEILSCLYETQDEDFVGKIMPHFLQVVINQYDKNEKQENISYQAVAYCLVRSTVQHTVTFNGCVIGPKARSVLSKAFSKRSQLRFNKCKFPVTEDVIRDGSSLSGLFGQSQMEKVEFERCDLTPSCSDDLRFVITTNRSLTSLDLTHNALGDSGLKVLCEGLRHPACALKDLGLEHCGLTSSCCADLRSVITINRSLTRLDLSWNALKDSGIKLLCEGLRHPACALQDLVLWRCDLTPSCCDDLYSVLTTNRSLTSLVLSGNKLQDDRISLLCIGMTLPEFTVQDPGLKFLCEGLRHPACVLQDLRLERCGLTSFCCADLGSVLTINHSLTRLDLSWNFLQDSGMKLLCEGLRHPACTLQELILQQCGLTFSCCEDLHSVLTTNRSLTILDLSWNTLEDYGIKLLCEGLRHPACVLQKLTLQTCALYSCCCADFRSVITTNHSLITLDLSYNALGDSGVKCLFKGLRHPACTLQELKLRHCGLTSSCCADLRSVITTNRSLTRLDLSYNDPVYSLSKFKDYVRPSLQLLL